MRFITAVITIFLFSNCYGQVNSNYSIISKFKNIEKDPTELNDLAKVFPEKLDNMYKAWKEWAEYVQVFPMDSREYNVRSREYKRKIMIGKFLQSHFQRCFDIAFFVHQSIQNYFLDSHAFD